MTNLKAVGLLCHPKSVLDDVVGLLHVHEVVQRKYSRGVRKRLKHNLSSCTQDVGSNVVTDSPADNSVVIDSRADSPVAVDSRADSPVAAAVAIESYYTIYTTNPRIKN